MLDASAVLNEIRAQRNQALDMLANANGFIATLQARIAELEKQASEKVDAGPTGNPEDGRNE